MDQIGALLRQPGKATADAFCHCIAAYRDWGVSFGEAVNRFMADSEGNRRNGRPPLPDW
ncbi:MAG: hypothetical protein JXB47_04845 [Anaerolineae bacterium]|nr:hypothetical protein [Anaerolineae bacterium]